MKAILVDFDAWKLLSAFPPAPEKPDKKIQFRTRYEGIPIIHSPYILATTCVDEPLSIIKDFDRWFRVALLMAEDRLHRDKERRREQSLASASL